MESLEKEVEELKGQSQQVGEAEQVKKGLKDQVKELEKGLTEQKALVADLQKASDEKIAKHKKELEDLKEVQEAETKEMDVIL